jgi:hypothetical protein
MLIVCRNCDSKVSVPDGAVGKRGKCPKCGHIFTIPAASPEPAPEPAPEDEGIIATPPAKQGVEVPKAPRRDPEEEERPSRRHWEDEDDDEDEDFRDLRRLRDEEEQKGLSLASMILGIVAISSATLGAVCCGMFSTPISLICGIVAVILGLIGKNRGGRPLAITGISLGAAAAVMAVGCGLLSGLWVGFVLWQGP